MSTCSKYLDGRVAELRAEGCFYFEASWGQGMAAFKITPQPGGMLAGEQLDSWWEPTASTVPFAAFIQRHAFEVGTILDRAAGAQ